MSSLQFHTNLTLTVKVKTNQASSGPRRTGEQTAKSTAGKTAMEPESLKRGALNGLFLCVFRTMFPVLQHGYLCLDLSTSTARPLLLRVITASVATSAQG